MAGVYFSQLSVVFFCPGFSCRPSYWVYARGIPNRVLQSRDPDPEFRAIP